MDCFDWSNIPYLKTVFFEGPLISINEGNAGEERDSFPSTTHSYWALARSPRLGTARTSLISIRKGNAGITTPLSIKLQSTIATHLQCFQLTLTPLSTGAKFAKPFDIRCVSLVTLVTMRTWNTGAAWKRCRHSIKPPDIFTKLSFFQKLLQIKSFLFKFYDLRIIGCRVFLISSGMHISEHFPST